MFVSDCDDHLKLTPEEMFPSPDNRQQTVETLRLNILIKPEGSETIPPARHVSSTMYYSLRRQKTQQ